MSQSNDRYGGRAAGGKSHGAGGGKHGADSSSPADRSEDPKPPAAPGGGGAAPPSPAAGTGLLPALALPRGGGAIRGIGEKFTTTVSTGTGALSVPIATSPGRDGAALGLELHYDSGAGNGPFGLGWKLSLPSIARQTDKGLPRYADGDGSDIFVLSGAEDLVPVRVPDGAGTRLDVVDRGEFRVQRYRPRVEGMFSRIERWTRRATGDAYWRVIGRDNTIGIYGQTAQARIADPDHPERTFSWLLEEMRDDRGNVVCYRYKPEDATGVDPGIASEANRFVRNPDGSRRFTATAQRYVKRIQYGNRTPVARDQPAPSDDGDGDWMFEVVFDYGEHDAAAPTPAEAAPWPVRPDPFSSHRATFEVRSYRLCRRVLMFHRFAELGDTPCLVRSTDLTYQDARVRSPDGAFDSGAVASYLATITSAGYLRAGAGYERAALPALELGYAQPIVHDEPHPLDPGRAELVPSGPRGGDARWVDLDGAGIPGVLVADERAWYYRANAGGGALEAPALQRTLPAPGDLGAGVQLTDLEGDGNLDLVRYAPPLAGYFARTPERGWAPFHPLPALPAIDWNDPDLRFVDLDGDGFSDVLITEDDAFVCYRSRARSGFDPAVRVRHGHQELEGPALVFADRTEAIQLADMTGDGLVDLVRVRNGEVCYWPNLGYGRFGRKVTMDHGPRFDTADLFTAARVRFADIDGSGTSDLVYLGRDGVTVYFNRSGNALAPALRVGALPRVDALSTVDAIDLLGQGTSCLVWASSDRAAAPAVYVDLMGGKKPHLLESAVNNLGAETRITYAPSTQFYLQDKAEGRPWLTRLALPVHVIEQVEHVDRVADSRLVTRFRYHHGFFDGYEREFGGFGCVEQWDAESFTGDLDVPPLRTVTWFHTGAWLERERLERALANDYYPGDPQAPLLPDTILPAGLTVREEREAARAMRGQILRQEVYGEDGRPESVHPYAVSERSYEIRVVQRADGAQHAVCFVHPRETIDLHYERQPADPRTQHQLVLDVDDFGAVTRSAAIGYPRRIAGEPEQGRMWISVTEATVANRAGELDWYRIGVAVSSQQSELTGLSPPTSGVIAAGALRDAITAAAEIPFEATASGGALQRRVVKRQRVLYSRDDLSGPLALGTIESLAIPYESYQQAFTAGLITQVHGDQVTSAMLTGAGYVLQDGLWWAPSGRVIRDPAKFYLPTEAIDPFGQHYLQVNDAYSLLPLDSQDPVGNRITIGLRDAGGTITQNGNDYRVLAPALLTDSNHNRSAVAFDALGMVVRVAAMGKAGAGEGDTLDDPTVRLEYDLHAWHTTGKPVLAHTLAREQHGAANPRWQESYCYSDGSGREVMTKVQAEPGLVPVLDGDGHVVRNPDGTPQTVFVASRWVGSGRTVFDNKNNPVKQYEPFFSATFAYEDEREIVEWGVTPILRYDPLSRLVRTDYPDGTHTRAVFDAWRQDNWDHNDTIAGTPWLARKQAGSPAEQRAAALALAHAGTPTVIQLDSLGRPFLTIADNGPAGTYPTRTALDIEGHPRTVTDARGIVAATHGPDMLGRALRTTTSDAGESRQLLDVAGKPAFQWTARGHRLRRSFDALQRATHLFVQLGAASELLAERVVWGELHPDAENRNLRGAMHQSYDGAGVAVTVRRDFQGNAIETARRLAADYHAAPDWTPLATLTSLSAIEAAAASLLDTETFTTTASFDALDRLVSRITPDASETRPSYNEANLIERLEVRIRGAATATAFVQNIDYNAHGQRERIEHGNGTVCTYQYDPFSFRLVEQRTTRTGDGLALQDLAYEYDPVGNIVQLSDAVAFARPDVSADGLYVYDAIYQLVSADGREHPGQQPTADDAPLLVLDHPSDLQALRRYRETYSYDPAGNLGQVSHQPLGGGPSGWTRNYHYATDSNRLLATSLPGDATGVFSAAYSHDAGGNMTAMPHLAQLGWDHESRFVFADRGGGGQVYFTYDAAGQRVRKAYDHGGFVEERIYLDGYELYRNRNRTTGEVALARQTLHVIDDARLAALVETKTIDTSIPGFAPVTRQRYQLANQLESTASELDEAGAVISYEEYFPYGGTSWQASSSSTDVSRRRYRYTGKERDDETGLYYHGARYYAPWLGRWISPDPSGPTDGPNLYCYVLNNPIAFRDADGREVEAYVIGPQRPGKQRFGFFLGIAAHRLIAFHYKQFGAQQGAQETIYANFISVETILKDIGAKNKNIAKLTEAEKNLRPDITNTSIGEVFEIKADKPDQLAIGRAKVKEYVNALNKGDVRDFDYGSKNYRPKNGTTFEYGVMFKGGKTYWKLSWRVVEKGLIGYKWQRYDMRKPGDKSIAEAMKSQDWVDVSDEEAEASAEALYKSIDEEMSRSDMLSKYEDFIQGPIDIIAGAVVNAIQADMINSQTVAPPATVPKVPPVKAPTPTAPSPVQAPGKVPLPRPVPPSKLPPPPPPRPQPQQSAHY